MKLIIGLLMFTDLLILISWRCLHMAFADSIAKLDADVTKLIAENGPGAVTAALAAQDAAHAAAVDAVDAKIPAPPPAA